MFSNFYLSLSKLRNVFTKRSFKFYLKPKSNYMIFSWCCVSTVCTARNCLYIFGRFLLNDKGELHDPLFSSKTTKLILTIKDERH